MHIIMGITSYERDTEEVKNYLKNLKEVEYFREIKFYDIICDESHADFIANILYPSSTYQKLYNKIPSLIRFMLEKAGIKLHKPQPEKPRQEFLIRSKACFILQADDNYSKEGDELI